MSKGPLTNVLEIILTNRERLKTRALDKQASVPLFSILKIKLDQFSLKLTANSISGNFRTTMKINEFQQIWIKHPMKINDFQ